MAKATTLDDIAESIADLTTMMANEFSLVRQEMATKSELAELRSEMATKSELAELRSEMATKQDLQATRQDLQSGLASVRSEMREGFEKISRQLDGHEEDIRQLYLMIDDLRKELKSFTREERRRLDELEAFALRVAEKTGIPYNPPKSKPRS